jgi:hypothetical protein
MIRPPEIQKRCSKIKVSFSLKKSSRDWVQDKAKEWECSYSAVIDWLIEKQLRLKPDYEKGDK